MIFALCQFPRLCLQLSTPTLTIHVSESCSSPSLPDQSGSHSLYLASPNSLECYLSDIVTSIYVPNCPSARDQGIEYHALLSLYALVLLLVGAQLCYPVQLSTLRAGSTDAHETHFLCSRSQHTGWRHCLKLHSLLCNRFRLLWKNCP